VARLREMKAQGLGATTIAKALGIGRAINRLPAITGSPEAQCFNPTIWILDCAV
jgi:hypothetical protein